MQILPKRPTTRGRAEWFTGEAWLATLGHGQGGPPMTIGSVHFTPGARSAWHQHSIGQTLYVTEGEGRVQCRDATIVTIRPGDVVLISAGEWHWHGAAPDHFMTHLALTEGNTEWGEHVGDAGSRDGSAGHGGE
jgi:quercetin dioxygenase-like cupin family protein